MIQMTWKPATSITWKYTVLLTAMLILLILGVAGIILGIAIYGTSRHVTFGHVNHAHIAHYLFSTSRNIGYVETSDTRLYIIDPQNLTPLLDASNLRLATRPYRDISFFYDASSTTHLDLMASNTGAHLVGDAFSIVHLTYVSSDGKQQVYTSDLYKTNPKGYYLDNRPEALIAIAVSAGLLIAGIALSLACISVRRKDLAQQYSYTLVYDLTP